MMVATSEPAIAAGRPTRSPSAWAPRVVMGVCVLVTAACAVLAGGIETGRWRLWSVQESAPNARVESGSLVFLEPVTFGQLHGGDLIVTQEQHASHAKVVRVDGIVSSIDKAIEVRDGHDKSTWLKLGHGTIWRVSHRVPFLGAPLGSLPGSIVGWLLVVAGGALLCFARAREWYRQRRAS